MENFKYNVGTYNPKLEKNQMTLIIGAKCKDGVVLVGDRKIVDSGTGDVYAEDKINEVLQNVFFASAGLTDLSDKFNASVELHVRNKEEVQKKKMQKKGINKEKSVYEHIKYFIEDCEDLISELKMRYQRVISAYQQGIEVLIGIRTDEGGTELCLLETRDCVSHLIKKNFYCIGTGSPYAKFFLKELWNENLTMEQTAGICEFVIDYVEHTEIDTYVGKGVQVVFIPDVNMRAKQLLETIPLSKKDEKYLDKFIVSQYHKPKKVLSKDKQRVKRFSSDFKKMFKKKYWRY